VWKLVAFNGTLILLTQILKSGESQADFTHVEASGYDGRHTTSEPHASLLKARNDPSWI
jgi:hypothetical protein